MIELDISGMAMPMIAEAGGGFWFPEGKQAAAAYDVAEAEGMLDAPETPAFESKFVKHMVQNTNSYIDSVVENANVQAGGFGAEMQASLSTSRESKATSSNIIFSVSNYVKASQPTLMHGCPLLSETARRILEEQGEAVFAKQYGTHFVYGFRSAAAAHAEIIVEVSDKSSKSELAAKLNVAYNSLTMSGSADGSAALSKAMKQSNVNAKTEFYSSGTTSSPASDSIEDISKWVFKLTDSTSADASRSRVVLKRHSFCAEYRTIVPQPKPAASLQLMQESDTKLMRAWTAIQYTRRSYSKLRASPNAVIRDAVQDADLETQINVLDTELRALMNDSTPTTLTAAELREAANKIEMNALKLGFEIDDIKKTIRIAAAAAAAAAAARQEVQAVVNRLEKKWNRRKDEYEGWYNRPKWRGGRYKRDQYGIKETKYVIDALMGWVWREEPLGEEQPADLRASIERMKDYAEKRKNFFKLRYAKTTGLWNDWDEYGLKIWIEVLSDVEALKKPLLP